MRIGLSKVVVSTAFNSLETRQGYGEHVSMFESVNLSQPKCRTLILVMAAACTEFENQISLSSVIPNRAWLAMHSPVILTTYFLGRAQTYPFQVQVA